MFRQLNSVVYQILWRDSVPAVRTPGTASLHANVDHLASASTAQLCGLCVSSKILVLLFPLLISASVFAEGEAFEPTSKDRLDAFYSRPERAISITIRSKETLHTVNPAFLGINLSYFNTTDEIWKRYDLQEKLKAANVGALRYPGGEETSFFHWKHPGVNGYEDCWDAPSAHGTSPGRGRFQTTWVAPEKWDTNESFMNFDEFMANCIALGAEPIVGLNLSSGKKHNRRADGITEALDWMRYCKEKGYKVTYWFLDNEPWHHEAAHTFSLKEYAEECLATGRAIKKEFPDAKLIANPSSSSGLHADGIEQFIKVAGPVIDYIDVHWYWAWGKGSLEHWLAHTPLTNEDKWKDPSQIRTYAQDIALIRAACTKAGFPNIGIASLEWNIAPSDWSQTFNQSLIAIIQAELLMEFAANNVELTGLWPLIWQTSRDVWSEQDSFPSIVTSDPPFNPTLSLDMFRMLSGIAGKQLVKVETENSDIVTLATEQTLCVINKNPLRRRVTVETDFSAFAKAAADKPTGQMIGMKHQVVNEVAVEAADSTLTFFAEPFSFNTIRIKP